MGKIFSYIFLALLSYLLWKVASFFYFALEQSSAQTVAAIIGGMVTVIGGIAAVVITQRQTKQREIDEAHRGKKIEIYKNFIDMAANALAAANEKLDIEPLSENELNAKILQFNNDILLWGSPKVIKAYLNFRATSGSIDTKQNILVAINEIYKMMREDIGLSNKELNNNELIKIFLTDPYELDCQLQEQKNKPEAKAPGNKE